MSVQLIRACAESYNIIQDSLNQINAFTAEIKKLKAGKMSPAHASQIQFYEAEIAVHRANVREFTGYLAEDKAKLSQEFQASANQLIEAAAQKLAREEKKAEKAAATPRVVETKSSRYDALKNFIQGKRKSDPNLPLPERQGLLDDAVSSKAKRNSSGF